MLYNMCKEVNMSLQEILDYCDLHDLVFKFNYGKRTGYRCKLIVVYPRMIIASAAGSSLDVCFKQMTRTLLVKDGK